jgi:hypothetical protein
LQVRARTWDRNDAIPWFTIPRSLDRGTRSSFALSFFSDLKRTAPFNVLEIATASGSGEGMAADVIIEQITFTCSEDEMFSELRSASSQNQPALKIAYFVIFIMCIIVL